MLKWKVEGDKSEHHATHDHGSGQRMGSLWSQHCNTQHLKTYIKATEYVNWSIPKYDMILKSGVVLAHSL